MGDLERWLSYVSFLVAIGLFVWALFSPVKEPLLVAAAVAVLLGVFFIRKVKDRNAMNL